MKQLTSTELDSALRELIADPEKLDEVKEQIQNGQKTMPARSRLSEARCDDFDEMFDNMPI